MSMARRVAGTVILVIIIFIATYLVYHGLFIGPKFTEEKRGPYYMVCEKHIGDYSKTAKVMDRIYFSLLNNEKIISTRGFGLYYDNPSEVDKKNLRSIVGCLLDGQYKDRIDQLKKKYRIEEFPASWCLATAFPYRSELSILMGVIKVYPKLNRIMEKKEYPQVPIMEIYDPNNGRIDYIAGINIDKKYYDDLIAK